VATDKEYPIFDSTDQKVFSIEDARVRAETMQSILVPKLKKISDAACEIIRDVYQIEPLDLCSFTFSPAHRKNAQNTMLFDSAHAGLLPAQKVGGYHYFKLRVSLFDTGLRTLIQADRPQESGKLFELLRRHEDEAVQLLDTIGCDLFCDKGVSPDADNRTIIRTARIEEQDQWWYTLILGELEEYPIIDDDQVWTAIFDFVGMFPLLQSATELMIGVEERFEEYCRLFEAWRSPKGNDVEEDETEAASENPVQVEFAQEHAVTPTNVVESKPPQIIPPRIDATISRIIRDTVMARRIKSLYEHRCQVCGTSLIVRDGVYAEAAHIRPLGAPHNGPDTEENVLCLCPSCHVLFDLKGFSIADDLSLIGVSGKLCVIEGHSISRMQLAYHRKHIYGE